MREVACVVAALVAATIGGCRGCSGGADGPGDEPPGSLILATTTSTYDSGLLDALLPSFERATGLRTKVISVGSGQALMLGRRGEADALLVHSPPAEEEFMAGGHGESREPVMHNRFVLVGPPSDPAGIRGVPLVAEALSTIATKEATFFTRGDDSGTHRRELRLWAAAKLTPSGAWYVESGQGMGSTLRLASEKRGYTLSDIGTFLAQRDSLELEPLVDEDPALENPYHVIVVAAKGRPAVRVEAARRFSEYIRGAEAQKLIGTFGVDRFGTPLFHPDALPAAGGGS